MSTDAFADDVYQPDAGNDQHGEKFPDMEDALGEPNADDLMDTGYSPPEKPRAIGRFGETAEEERRGESLDQRLTQEVPDVWDDDDGDEPIDLDQVGGRRAGRLSVDDTGAHDWGIDGGAATAEEAAMHIIEPYD